MDYRACGVESAGETKLISLVDGEKYWRYWNTDDANICTGIHWIHWVSGSVDRDAEERVGEDVAWDGVGGGAPRELEEEDVVAAGVQCAILGVSVGPRIPHQDGGGVIYFVMCALSSWDLADVVWTEGKGTDVRQ